MHVSREEGDQSPYAWESVEFDGVPGPITITVNEHDAFWDPEVAVAVTVVVPVGNVEPVGGWLTTDTGTVPPDAVGAGYDTGAPLAAVAVTCMSAGQLSVSAGGGRGGVGVAGTTVTMTANEQEAFRDAASVAVAVTVVVPPGKTAPLFGWTTTDTGCVPPETLGAAYETPIPAALDAVALTVAGHVIVGAAGVEGGLGDVPPAVNDQTGPAVARAPALLTTRQKYFFPAITVGL